MVEPSMDIKRLGNKGLYYRYLHKTYTVVDDATTAFGSWFPPPRGTRRNIALAWKQDDDPNDSDEKRFFVVLKTIRGLVCVAMELATMEGPLVFVAVLAADTAGSRIAHSTKWRTSSTPELCGSVNVGLVQSFMFTVSHSFL